MKQVLIFTLMVATSAFSKGIIVDTAPTIETRFTTPSGYEREVYQNNSFGTYLRQLKLKNIDAPILLYNGKEKIISAHVSVIDMPILSQDLIQCADAVIKLKAEYLYKQKKYNEISFSLTNGMEVPFSRFAKGERVKVSGNKTSWVKGTYTTGYGRGVFEAYLKFIYTYAGTISLAKDTKKAAIKNIKIGDIFLQSGSPGHTVIVVDMATDKKTGKKRMILAQSHMPSQELHIIKSGSTISPWYEVEDGGLAIPEWSFVKGSLRAW